MTRRKVLVSAYACEPGLGSEPGIGWSWVREIARRHDVWLVTRANNVERIEAAARELGLESLRVVGHDLPRWARSWKRGGRGALLYFYLWQLSLARRARRLDREIGFDVVHHLTFASSWIPAGLAFVGRPFVWGPVGRHRRVPDRFLPSGDVLARIAELAKAAVKGTLARFDPLLARTRARADVILAIGRDDLAELPARARAKALAFRACGAETADLAPDRFERHGPFTVLFAGRLVDLKGVRLALEAFAELAAADPQARFEILGDGPRRASLERRARELGLAERVRFAGHVPRTAVLARLRRSDAFLFPSFEGAGMVVVEALAAGNPVVCLDHGGPGEMVDADRGLRVPLETTLEATARSLGRALVRLCEDEELRARLARGAHRWALAQAKWETTGERLEGVYELALERHARGDAVRPRRAPFRALLGRVLARAGAEVADLGELEALGILLALAGRFARGSLWRLRLGSARGPLFVARGVRITSAGRIAVGRNVKIEEGVELQGLARRGIVLGDGVTIGRAASIRPSSYYGRDLGAGLRVGPGSAIGAGAWIGASGFVDIGANVLLGPRVVIVPENHVHASTALAIKDQGVERADVTIEDDCWIGANATILAGVRIGRGSIVAAGAVVTRDVPPGAIVAGVPARLLRMRGEVRRSA